MKTDFTVDLTWWGLLRLAPVIYMYVGTCIHMSIKYAHTYPQVTGAYIQITGAYIQITAS